MLGSVPRVDSSGSNRVHTDPSPRSHLRVTRGMRNRERVHTVSRSLTSPLEAHLGRRTRCIGVHLGDTRHDALWKLGAIVLHLSNTLALPRLRCHGQLWHCEWLLLP